MYLHTDGNIDTSIISPLPKVSFYFLSVVTLFLNSKKFDSHFPYLLDGTLVHNQSLATDTVCHPPPGPQSPLHLPIRTSQGQMANPAR